MWVSIFATNSSSNKQRPATYLLHLSWRRAFSVHQWTRPKRDTNPRASEKSRIFPSVPPPYVFRGRRRVRLRWPKDARNQILVRLPEGFPTGCSRTPWGARVTSQGVLFPLKLLAKPSRINSISTDICEQCSQNSWRISDKALEYFLATFSTNCTNDFLLAPKKSWKDS